MPPTVNAVWVGDELGPIAAACLRSFVRMGHRTCLHAYDRVKDLPPGVELVDAAKIIERSKIVRHKRTGSFALFSDLYRYELLARGAGIYIDCDVYCVRPIRSREYVIGYERDGATNGAVLAMPSDCLLLTKLRHAAAGPGFIPPWLKPEKRIIHKLGYLLGLGRSAHSMPWGTLGPHALTYYVKELGLQNARPWTHLAAVRSRTDHRRYFDASNRMHSPLQRAASPTRHGEHPAYFTIGPDATGVSLTLVKVRRCRAIHDNGAFEPRHAALLPVPPVHAAHMCAT